MITRRSIIDGAIFFVLLVSSVVALGFAQLHTGIPRDEAVYFDAGIRYWQWVTEIFQGLGDGSWSQAFEISSVQSAWQLNHEHPPFMKLCFGMSHFLFFKKLGWLSEISALRLPSWLFCGICVGVIYLWTRQLDNRWSGLFAGLSFFLIPRVFFHAQLGCFDGPVTYLAFLTCYAYYRSLRSVRWGIFTGLFFGLTISTKHNGLFLPILFLLHYCFVMRRDFGWRPLKLPVFPLSFLSMAILGPLVFYILWPWLWFDTFSHMGSYLRFHLRHIHYYVNFLGTVYKDPPLPVLYPFIMLAATVPVATWLAGGYGVISPFIKRLRSGGAEVVADGAPARSWKLPCPDRPLEHETLLLLFAVFPVLLIALPGTPIFGGTKHFITAYPFLCMGAGKLIGEFFEKRISRHALRSVLLCFYLLPGLIAILLSHPFELSQYNGVFGGIRGGATLGLQRQFWGYASRQAMPWLNRQRPVPGRVYFHDTIPTALPYYKRAEILMDNIDDAGLERSGIDASDAALVVHEKHFNSYDYWIWESFGTVKPAYVVEKSGVPLVTVYQRSERTP